MRVTATSVNEADEPQSIFTDVTINLTDLAEPAFDNVPPGGYAFDLPENMDGATTPVEIGSVSAIDPSNPDSPHTRTISYVLDGADASSFSINNDGVITYTGDALDYETATKTSFTFTVTATSGGVPTDRQTITITLVGVPEIEIGGNTSFTLAENIDGSGSTAFALAGAITAEWDNAQDGGITLTLTDADGNEPANFEILNGAITYTGAGFDFERAGDQGWTIENGVPTLTLTVTATGISDANIEVEATTQVTITLTNENDAPELVEDADTAFPIGQGQEVSIATLFTDEDADDRLTFTLGDQSAGGLYPVRSGCAECGRYSCRRHNC